MKTILIPTDFSDTADNAMHYAAELSKFTKSKIILFHAYHLPVITTEVPVILPTLDEIEKDTMDALKNLKGKLQQKHGNELNVECVSQYGLAADEISEFEKINNIDIIVMGMHGAGFLSEKLMGSITTSLIRKVKCPVLAVSHEARFREIKKIILACDYKEVQNAAILDPLKEIMTLFKSHLYVVNVVREPAEIIPTTEQAIAGVKLEHSLEEVEHTYHFAENDNIVEGLNEFVDEEAADMVVMIPHAHSVLRNIFKEPYTKQMAFHTHVPLLFLNE